METRVQKWGNSLAVRLSKHIVEETKIKAGSRVGVEVDDGKIVLEVRERKQVLSCKAPGKSHKEERPW